MIPIAAPLLGPEEEAVVLEVLRSGVLTQGPVTEKFEQAFAGFCGVPFAVAVSSGTAALHLALLAHGIGPGDEVVTTPLSFIASANAIRHAGARPVFADIDPVTFNLSAACAEEAVTPRTKAILVVHLYGLPADMNGLAEVAERHGLALIEDACQAHGARYRGRAVGSFGTGCFSFYPSKNMTTGEGGMITTRSAELARRCSLLRSHGTSGNYRHELLGYNFRMTEISAAIGLCQLRKVTSFNEARRRNAAYLSERLAGLRGIVVPVTPSDRRHVFHQYTVRVVSDSRDAVRESLAAKAVDARVYYPIPIHRQPTYHASREYRSLSLPEAERASREVLSLPVHPALSREQLDRVAEGLREYLHPPASRKHNADDGESWE